jgi:hypothetical protein
MTYPKVTVIEPKNVRIIDLTPTWGWVLMMAKETGQSVPFEELEKIADLVDKINECFKDGHEAVIVTKGDGRFTIKEMNDE